MGYHRSVLRSLHFFFRSFMHSVAVHVSARRFIIVRGACALPAPSLLAPSLLVLRSGVQKFTRPSLQASERCKPLSSSRSEFVVGRIRQESSSVVLFMI